MNYWEMLEVISPYDYSIKNKIVNHTECNKRRKGTHYKNIHENPKLLKGKNENQSY